MKKGDVAQSGERYVRNVQVRGSNPLISTNKTNQLVIHTLINQAFR
jgi:hypothetical protein